jgi:hypothetical protein
VLSLPTKGFRRSIKVHNIQMPICCDWIEASVLFCDDVMTGADIVDVLCDEHFYDSQEFAWAFVNDALSNMRQRQAWIGAGYPFAIVDQRVTRLGTWQDYVPYAFCLMLSLAESHQKWVAGFGADFTEQGQLFEELTAEALRAHMNGWVVHPTGWTRTNAKKLGDIVNNVAAALGETTGQLKRWTKAAANEAGLDIVCYHPYPDSRVGLPAFFFQCASGTDWIDKVKTPDLRVWTKIIQFASDPKKAFAMPFALDEGNFVHYCNIVDGLLLDRHRLLVPGQNNRDWLPDALKGRLTGWLAPRISAMPVFDAAA